ncbi:MAG: thiamine phosphate synthase [Vicinamibacteria bacterium]
MARLPPGPFLYPILDAALLAGRPCGAAVAALARGGARIVQVRAKGASDRVLFALAQEALAAARASGVLLVVNDRPDVALMLGADGVHLGQDDLPPAEARRLLGPDAIVGWSTHSVEQLDEAAAEPVDYVAFGPVFPTATKRDADPVVGLDRLRTARARTARPLVAIGGITTGNARATAAAGADGLAVISGLLSAPDLAAAARAFAAAIAP